MSNEGASQTTTKKYVRFFSNVTVREIPKRGKSSDQWYSKSELYSLGVSNKHLISMLQKSGLSSKSIIEMRTGNSMRGLEIACSGEREKRVAVRYLAAQAVMYEQELQRQEHGSIFDPEAIAMAYSQANKEAILGALEYGWQDEKEVLLEGLADGSDIHNKIKDMMSASAHETPKTRRRRHRKLVSAAA